MLRIAKSGSRFGGLQPRSGLTRTSSAYTDYVILRFFASSSSTNGNNGSSKGNKKNIEDDGYGHETKIHPDQAPSIPSSSALDGKESTFLNNGQLLNTVYTHVVKKFQDPPSPGTLILVRHGESEWNHRKLFTGWVDVDLSERGIQEIEHAARLLLERGYTVDITYTSMLKRAIRSSWIILNEINQIYRPIIKSWRLNERMYGALEGHSKPGLAKLFGEEIVQGWRGGLNDRPPSMTAQHLYYHGYERKYRDIFATQDDGESTIPLAESLQDTIDRTIPLWDSHILPDLKAGRNVMIVAHRNSLRGIVKHIDAIGTEDIQKIGIPNGIPLVYKFDANMKPLPHKNAVPPISGIWLEKKGLLRKALDKEEELAKRIEGYNSVFGKPQDKYRGIYNSKSSLSEATTLPIVSAAPGGQVGTGHGTGSIASNASNVSTGSTTSTNPTTGSVTQPIIGISSPNLHVSSNRDALLKSLSILESQRKILDQLDRNNKYDYPNITDTPDPYYQGTALEQAQTTSTHPQDAVQTPVSASPAHIPASPIHDQPTPTAGQLTPAKAPTNPAPAKPTDAFDTSYADIFIDPMVLNSAAYTNIPIDFFNSYQELVPFNSSQVDPHSLFNPQQLPINIPSPTNSNLEVITRLNQNHFFANSVPNVCEVNIKSSHEVSSSAAASSSSSTSASSSSGGAVVSDHHVDPVLKKPLLIIIRHGKTEHNQLGLFTGWEDAMLAEEGREEAMAAGRLLRQHGIEFDVIYTSWLSRAIETAWLVMNELDSLWLPIVKTWRLNERMYGALTGLSKKMIRQIYGDEQFMKWRRGFATPPPTISSFSHAYPGNDSRYVNYVKDVDISIFETLIRSLAHGKFEIHRKFPKAESLQDCMERTIPYFRSVIHPESIAPGKNVLIASSENAIRGLLMHLCDIPQDKIPFVEIPTGLPLVYDPTQRKIRLLQDGDIGTKINPLEKYKFGTAPELLFKLHPSKTDYDRMTSISNVDAELRTKTQTPYWDDIMIKSRK